ncbi:MAG: Ig-like domain-containing protein, partial [Treponema sp.]|nr:Ig-like domain-containing protein [Treponema sp.]
MKKLFTKSLTKSFKKFLEKISLVVLSIFMFSCDLWMNNDNIFKDIENEVKIANAPKINVFVRYAMTRQGETNPNGYSTFKVGIPHDISATTDPEYGFVRWAAFPTSYLSTGDEVSNNKKLYFVNDEDYNKNFKQYELSEDVITFENSKSPTTVVTINKQRNDIFLVPIIALRPTVEISIPSKGSTNVVRNMSVRINFTKPMNADSFKNKQGEYDKITITQGSQTFTPDGDIELDSKDITDLFEFNDSMFSKNKKMITLKFKDEFLSEGYASQSSVIITISKEVQDEYGYTMTDDNEISFTVGSKKDSLAPRITWLTAGPEKQFELFQGVYKDEGTSSTVGEKTRITLDGAKSAPKNYVGDSFFDNYITNRIGNSKFILRVFAEDLAGSGSNQSQDGIEADVAQIGIRAQHLYYADGTPDTESEMSEIKYYTYLSGQNNTSMEGSYLNLVKSADDNRAEGLDTLSASYGSLFEYDELSKMPDGLIQIDVAAVDIVQNIGFFEGGNCSDEYGNGYASLFIVKDTQAPDVENNRSRVQPDLSIVPNGKGYFNEEYYKELKVIQNEEKPIVEHPINNDVDNADDAEVDEGDEFISNRLTSPNSALKWIVRPGTDTSWINSITAEDPGWNFVKDGYKPANSSVPTEDGPVPLTYALMDDLGNISEAILIDSESIVYDNTRPVIGDDGIQIQGVDGYVSSSITGNILEHHVISIPVKDEWAGLEAIEIGVTCNKEGSSSEEYETPFETAKSGKLIVKVDDEERKLDTDYTINGKVLTFKKEIPLEHEDILSEHIVTIQGLQIADSGNVKDDSTYRIAVKLTDAALNDSIKENGKSNWYAEIKNDSTAPVINSIKVDKIQSGKVVGGDVEYWTTETEPQTALYINFTETNTGAKVFDFTGSSIKLTDDSVLIWNGKEYNREQIDIENNVITIKEEKDAVITKASGDDVKIKNVELTPEDTGNTVNLTITDLVTNKSEKKANFILTDNTEIGMFRYDSETPVVN